MTDTKPHIALIVPSLSGGGAERMMLNLASGFAQRGLRVDLVLVRAEGPHLSHVPPEVRVVDLNAKNIGAWGILSSIPALLRYLRRDRPDALLSSVTSLNLVALWTKAISGLSTRVVIRESNTISLSAKNARSIKHRLMPHLARYCYHWADGAVAVSHGAAEDLARTIRFPLHRIRVIRNPTVTPKLFAQAQVPIEHPWFATGEPPVILGVGRLTRQKDFPTLICAFSKVRTKRLSRLIICGEGEERRYLESLVQRLGLEQDVAVPGFVDNIFAYMRRSSIFVLSSAWEGLPNVLIEAMACGTPVVSTDCQSGPREILEGGRYGPLVPIGDVEGLAEAILKVIEDPPPPDVLRRRANEFSLEKSVANYLAVLNLSK